MVTPRATVLIHLDVSILVKIISEHRVPNHVNLLLSILYAMAIIRLTTRDALSIKNFNNDADIFPIKTNRSTTVVPTCQHSAQQLNNKYATHKVTNTRDRSYANVTGNDTTQNKNADSPSSNNLENVISKFLDDFKSMINPLLALLTDYSNF